MSGETAGRAGGEICWLPAAWETGRVPSSISGMPEGRLVLWEYPWLPGLARETPTQPAHMLCPGSEFIPQLGGVVHAEERRWLPLEVPFSLHKGGEGGNTVADEVVGLPQYVQVNLGHLGFQAHYLHLQEEGQSLSARLAVGQAGGPVKASSSHIVDLRPLS